VTDHRKVPLEVLREFTRDQAELTSLRAVADDAGVGRSTLHKFVQAGTHPHPRTRRLLALWYLRRRVGIDETELIRPYRAALALLVGEVPSIARERSLAEVLDGIARGHVTARDPVPRWLEVVRERIDRGSFWDRSQFGEAE
jgi:hypothetical protein